MQPFVIDNFITRDTALYLNSYLREKAIVNPKGLLNVYLKPLTIKEYEDPQSHIVHDLIKLAVDSISNQFGFKKNDIVLDRVNYQVLQKGDSLGWHTDAYGGVDGYTNSYYSALLYLTDDYEGGEILFYDNNSGSAESGVSYKPTAGTLIHFKGDENHPHSVNEVLSGERSNLILFFNHEKQNDENI
jgi:predicted 2-oxoglutarate/Fe(II)-dependent dioxygenase YbiX